jgi:SAM-dependent methyltransferase|tara:strand:- start:496 stop:1236 length:741 start_codon:yes stop_codon:yes gene_type:complete
LRKIVPDISQQESSDTPAGYWEIKRRGLQAFQCNMMLKSIELLPIAKERFIVDIGDSAGTHMLYLTELLKNKCQIKTISVNLDSRAIEKIKKRGLNAVLSRAEDLDLGRNKVDLFTSFQMVEHLHNPALFFRRLAMKGNGDFILLTVPYLTESRVGLHQIRHKTKRPYYAEDEHIFELSPEDWKLLFCHAGWKEIFSECYYQYPINNPLTRPLWRQWWKATDYEGFWAILLSKDLELSDYYQDWED